MFRLLYYTVLKSLLLLLLGSGQEVQILHQDDLRIKTSDWMTSCLDYPVWIANHFRRQWISQLEHEVIQILVCCFIVVKLDYYYD